VEYMKNKMHGYDWIAVVLLVIGGLNWGLIGLFGFDLIAFIFGSFTMVSRILYVLVGISAFYLAIAPGKIACETRYPAAVS